MCAPRSVFFFASILLIVLACPADGQISALRLMNKIDIQHKKQFNETTIGGLSGIDYDAKDQKYYLICDDRSAINPARFYTAKIYSGNQGIDSVRFLEVHAMLQSSGKVYPSFKEDPKRTPDPEAIRYNPQTGTVVWSSEGERIVKENNTVIQNPSITISKPTGEYIDTIPAAANTYVHAAEKGIRQNGGFEAMTFSTDYKKLFYSVELPLFQDGPEPTTHETNSFSRIYQTDVATGKNEAQYAYKLEAVAYPSDPVTAFKVNGMVDLLALGDGKFISVERSFSMGRLACTVKVFLIDIAHAENVMENASLKDHPTAHPVSKKLLLNMDDLGIYIDNVEGVTFGPDLSNGHRTLIFVSDDNFQIFEKMQLLMFEVIP